MAKKMLTRRIAEPVAKGARRFPAPAKKISPGFRKMALPGAGLEMHRHRLRVPFGLTELRPNAESFRNPQRISPALRLQFAMRMARMRQKMI